MTSSGTAEQGTDFSAETGTLTFSAGQTEQGFTYQTTNDAIVEQDETFSVTLSGATGAKLAGDGSTLVQQVLIRDNDYVPLLLYAEVDKDILTLYHYGFLDETSVPDPSDFTVTVGGNARTVHSVSVGQPRGFLFFAIYGSDTGAGFRGGSEPGCSDELHAGNKPNPEYGGDYCRSTGE